MRACLMHSCVDMTDATLIESRRDKRVRRREAGRGCARMQGAWGGANSAVAYRQLLFERMKATAAALLLGAASAQNNNVTCVAGNSSLYDGSHSVTLLNSTSLNLSTYKGSVLMVTNVASF